MAGVETDVFCEGECHHKLDISKVAESKTANGKVTVCTDDGCECVVSARHNNSRVADPLGENASSLKQSRRENFLPNGCLRHKLGENGLISHSATADLVGDAANKSESVVNSNSSSSTQYSSETTESTSTGNESLSLLDSQDTKSEAAQEKSRDFTKDSDIACCSRAVSDLTLTDCDVQNGIEYVVYESEFQMPNIMRLITKDLSEPYSIYTYRYFIHNWPKLCFLAMSSGTCVGAIVCKLDMHKKMVRRGYIAMLAIDSEFRRKRIGSHLVLKAIKAMIADDCDEVVLETEITNKAALRLYENLGFVRDKRLFRYYLNGVDALRLKLWLR